MSRFGRDPRRSSGDLAYGDFYERESSHGGGGGGASAGAGGRWDPERFTRERERAARGRGPAPAPAPALVERDVYEEHDYYQPRPSHGRASLGSRRRESSADGLYGREGGRGAGPRFAEKDKFVFHEEYGPPARRRGSGRYHDDEIDTFDGSPARSTHGQMVAFEDRRLSINKDLGPSPRRAPPRPGIIRRQSSLDTFDRRPLPRYGDRFKDPDGPPETIVVPASAKRISPPRYVERDFEDGRALRPNRFADEAVGGYREREISIARRRRADSEAEFVERNTFVEKDTFEIEEDEREKPYPRKGKTKMPAKLVNKRAIIELGYPFEQEVLSSRLLLEEPSAADSTLGGNNHHPQGLGQRAH